MWQRYLTALKTNPIRTNLGTALIVTTTGDVLAQRLERQLVVNDDYNNEKTAKNNDFDLERTMTVCSYWTLTSIPAVYWFRWLDRQFPIHKVDARGLLTLGRKLTVHLGVFAPTINACFYGWLILKSQLFQKNNNNNNASSSAGVPPLIESSFWAMWYTKLDNDLFETQKASVMTWGTAQTFNFLFLPGHVRVLFTSLVSVFWTAYVSVVGHR